MPAGVGRARVRWVVLLGTVAGVASCGDKTPSSPDVQPALTTEFEGSSLGSWSRVGRDTIQFALRQDTNATTRYWFSFQVEEAAGRDLVFRTAAADNMYGAAGWNTKQPVASTDGGATWSRIVATEQTGGFFVFRYRPITNADRIALTLPYDFSRWLAYRSSIESDPWVQSSGTIGSSIEGNSVHMVEITDPAVASDSKAQVWAVARQHPGEPEGSYMIEGFTEWLLGDTPAAASLRSKARVFLVPFLNPDGVLAGNQRVNSAGLDMNRQWTNPTQATAPTVMAAQAKMFEMENDGTGIRIVLDFHGAPPARSNFFIYNDEASVPAPLFSEMQSLLTAAITTNTDFNTLGNSIARPIGDGERTRSWAYQFLGAHGLTIEASGVDTSYGPLAGQQMTEVRYMELGASVGQAVAEVLFP